jgi:hypothetical protein
LRHDIVKHLRSGNEYVSFGPIYALHYVSLYALTNFILLIRSFLFFVLSKNIMEKYQKLDYRSKVTDWPNPESVELVLGIQKSYFSVNLEAKFFIECKDEGSMLLVLFVFDT